MEVDKIVRRSIQLKKVGKIKRFNKFWAIARLCEEFSIEEVRSKKVLGKVSGKLNISKESILWFIKETLEKQNNDKEINR